MLAVMAALMVATMRAKVLQVVDLVTSSYIVYVLAPRWHTLLVVDYEGHAEVEGDIARVGKI